MSDGPLYSPSMSKPCKRLAKACGNDASSIDERVEQMEKMALHTLQKEGGDKALKKIAETLHSLEGDLFQDDRAGALESIRNDISQSAFSQSLLDNIHETVCDGLSTHEAIETGLGNAIQSRVNSEGRSIVEHCLESDDVSQSMAMKVNASFNEANSHFQPRMLARNIIQNGAKKHLGSSRRQSIDEGPTL